jgi:ADP-ribose pyrophosphatase
MSEGILRHAGRWLRFFEHPSGWEYASRAQGLQGVVIMARTTDDEIILVEQHRVPVNQPVIELPAGLAGDDVAGEAELLAAQRELFEETGYGGGTWRFLLAGPTSAGLSDEIVHLFLADGVTRQGEGGGVEQERITVHAIPLRCAADWLLEQARTGRYADPKVYAALFFLGAPRPAILEKD